MSGYFPSYDGVARYPFQPIDDGNIEGWAQPMMESLQTGWFTGQMRLDWHPDWQEWTFRFENTHKESLPDPPPSRSDRQVAELRTLVAQWKGSAEALQFAAENPLEAGVIDMDPEVFSGQSVVLDEAAADLEQLLNRWEAI